MQDHRKRTESLSLKGEVERGLVKIDEILKSIRKIINVGRGNKSWSSAGRGGNLGGGCEGVSERLLRMWEGRVNVEGCDKKERRVKSLVGVKNCTLFDVLWGT